MNVEELAALGISVHLIKGYGDTAVAECAFALMWAAAKGFAVMDRGMRAGNWLRSDGVQLTGKTVGLLGRSEEHTSELQSLMRISYAVVCLKKKKQNEKIVTQNKQEKIET